MSNSKKATVSVVLLVGTAVLMSAAAAAWGGPTSRSHSSTHDVTARAVFAGNCAVCHGSTGVADTPVGKAMNAADLTSKKVQAQSNAELAHFIAAGEGQMPAFQNVLSHAEILGQVRYIRLLAREK